MREMYLLAGQSNMSGRGLLSELPTFNNANHIFLYKNDGTIQNPAQEPTDDPYDELLSVQIDLAASASCGLAFAEEMYNCRNGAEIAIMNCAKGGSSIASWQRAWDLWTLYGGLRWRAENAQATSEIKGLIFYQGESDTYSYDAASNWSPLFSEFVGNFRQDIGIPNLPVVFVQLGPTPVGKIGFEHWDTLVSKQSGIRMKNVAMVSARDLIVQSDLLHLTTSSLITLGKRIASAMNTMLQ